MTNIPSRRRADRVDRPTTRVVAICAALCVLACGWLTAQQRDQTYRKVFYLVNFQNLTQDALIIVRGNRYTAADAANGMSCPRPPCEFLFLMPNGDTYTIVNE